MPANRKEALVILGATASGKTALGVRLARALGGEILSADSRQVYRGLDIGAGKDLREYSAGGPAVAYHLIDVVGLDHEFSLFEYQRLCFEAYRDVVARGALPIVVGGTGLYIESVLKGYRLEEVPGDPGLRAELARLSNEDLRARLRQSNPSLHNVTDLHDRDRTIRAIEIAEFHDPGDGKPAPDLNALILGVRWPRKELHERIAARLKERLGGGLIEEVENLLAQGVSSERLHTLGLEYRFVADFLEGGIRSRNDLFQKLNSAIRNFAKRQETWFRRMERNGVAIHWIDRGDEDQAWPLLEAAFPDRGARAHRA